MKFKRWLWLLPVTLISGLFVTYNLEAARTYIQNWQVVQDSIMESLNLPNRSSNQVILDQLDLELQSPLKIHGAITPDSKLYFDPSAVEKGDGAGQTLSPSDDQINVFVASTIDYQTGSTTGGSFEVEGGSFALPACTVGQFKRHVFKYLSDGNKIDSKFSPEAATMGGLENAGTTFASLGGTPVGYIDLECTDVAGKYKTSGSATSVIEGKVGVNTRIFRFGSGSGGGAGEIVDFKVQSVASDGTVVIKGGALELADGRYPATYDGSGTASTDFKVDISFDLDNLEASPVNDTTYFLYLDVASLSGTPTVTSDTEESLYPVEEANFYLGTNPKEDMSSARWVSIGSVRYGTGAWSNQALTSPVKKIPNPSVVVSPLEYTLDQQAVGTVGSASQISAGHVLASGSFPSGADVSFYNLTDASDGNTSNAHDLTNNGTTPFTSSGILGVSNDAATLNGSTQSFSSTDAFFDPGDVDHSYGGCFKATDWTPAIAESMMTNRSSVSNADSSYVLQVGSSTIQLYSSDGTSWTLLEYDTSELVDNSWHCIYAVYDASPRSIKMYFDGKLVDSASGFNAQNSGVNIFSVGSQYSSPTNFFAGEIDEVFFSNGTAFTDNDIAKIYASKLSHNSGIPAKDQKWEVSALGANGIELNLSGFVQDKDYNDLYFNFDDQLSTTLVELRMFDMGASKRVGSVRSIKRQNTATVIDGSMPLSHGLPEKPTVLKLWVNNGTNWEVHDASAYFDASSTQVISTGTTLASILGGSTEVLLIASVGAEAVAVDPSFWNTYIASASQAIGAGDEVLCDVAGTLTLPSDPKSGARIRVIDHDGDFGTNNCTIGRNGKNINGSASDLVLDVDNGRVELLYNGSDNWILFVY